MADEIKKAPESSATPKAKGWKYVGPGSPGHKVKTVPPISNLPLDIGQLSLGTRPGTIAADQLKSPLIEYVMATNEVAKKYWVFD